MCRRKNATPPHPDRDTHPGLAQSGRGELSWQEELALHIHTGTLMLRSVEGLIQVMNTSNHNIFFI